MVIWHVWWAIIVIVVIIACKLNVGRVVLEHRGVIGVIEELHHPSSHLPAKGPHAATLLSQASLNVGVMPKAHRFQSTPWILHLHARLRKTIEGRRRLGQRLSHLGLRASPRNMNC